MIHPRWVGVGYAQAFMLFFVLCYSTASRKTGAVASTPASFLAQKGLLKYFFATPPVFQRRKGLSLSNVLSVLFSQLVLCFILMAA